MKKVTEILEEKLIRSPTKLSIDDIMELAKQKRAELGHDSLVLATFKSNPTTDDAYSISTYGLQDGEVVEALLDLIALFYVAK
jgi:hypothetical protein